MVSWFLLMAQLFPVLRLAVGLGFSKPNCVNHCGDVKIPYPFGIGADCFYNQSYEITCNTSYGSPKPFLHQFNLEVLNIDWPGRDSRWSALDGEQFSNYNGQILTVGLPRQNLCEITGDRKIIGYDLKSTPYRFSKKDNSLKIQGCGISAEIKTRNGTILIGCASICVGDTFNKTGMTCDGIGCCTASVPNDYEDFDLDFYEIDVAFEQLTDSISCNATVAYIDTNSTENYTGSLSSLATFPTTLRWKSTVLYQYCGKNHCSCGFCEGNPYLPNGCQGEECQNCLYNCGSGGNSVVYVCLGVVLLILGSYSLYIFVKRKREIRRKAKHFKRNGGLLLEQQMSSNEGVIETTKVFTVTELKKATDNFNDNRILGQGGQGLVHKGMLIDGRIVAIKTAKKVDESQVEQFINEVVILSQINHRNVVKILGCCLETEVPILVYEFIPNGTLYELIHNQSEEFHLNWKMRLQIAAESAGAVAYLHSSSSAPIYHRDIKSTNILLDEKYRAKVSDFGTSKAINIDQTHVTTAVLGTYGYLDPEYFLSNQFTEKSDVYSFGVVLVELITGRKPICPTGNGGWINLATEFLDVMEDGRVLDMLDARIINEGKEDEFMAIAELARKCLNMNGKRRPTMKEIAGMLDGIRSSHEELGSVKSIQDVTEVVYSDSNNPSCSGVFSSEDDPPACSMVNI